MEELGPLHLLRANLGCPLPLKPIGQAPYEAPMGEVRAFDPEHCLHRTLGKTWGPPFYLPASNKKLGSGEARYRSKKKKQRGQIFNFLFNKKAPIKQVNTVQAAQRPPEQA